MIKFEWDSDKEKSILYYENSIHFYDSGIPKRLEDAVIFPSVTPEVLIGSLSASLGPR
jgi:hypothetical protein